MQNISNVELIKLYCMHQTIEDVANYLKINKKEFLKTVKNKFGTTSMSNVVREYRITQFERLRSLNISDSNTLIEELFFKNRNSLDSFIRRIGYKKSDITNNVSTKKIFNEDIFSDDEFMSYVAGLIASDGTIDGYRNRIRILLHEKDVDILEKIKNKMFINHDEVKIYTSRDVYRELHITNAGLCKYLEDIGIISHKTETLCLNINKIKNINAFMRGYFDGDGCLSMSQRFSNKQNKVLKYLRAQYIGNYDTMSKFQEILEDNFIPTSLKRESIEKYNYPSYSLRIIGATKRNLQDFFNFLYEDEKSKIHLDRKFNRFKLLC